MKCETCSIDTKTEMHLCPEYDCKHYRAFVKEKLFTESFFLDWLHRLTVAGYKEEIMISADHKEIIAELYLNNLTPGEALTEYKSFLNHQ